MLRRYPSLFFLVFVVTGIVAADQMRLPSWLGILLSLLFLFGALWAHSQKRKTATAVLLGLVLCLLSAFHFSLGYVDLPPNGMAGVAADREVYHIFGRVSDWPDLKPQRTEIKISVDSLKSDITGRVQGAILLKVSDTTTALQRGDKVEFYGRIYPLPTTVSSGGFNYGRYLNLKGVQGIVYLPTVLGVRVDRRSNVGFLGFVDNIRDAISESLHRNLAPTSASLASGFLIGETREIPSVVYSMFRDSGTLHLLAVSGSNVALVVLFFVLLLRPSRFSQTGHSAVLLVVILVFAGLSYGEPSVIRASIMASLVIVARLLRRTVDLNNIIALTALIVLLADPAQLYDVGFQLSFGTAWGLIFLVPKLISLFRARQNRWWYRYLVFPLLIAAIAQVCSMPIVAYYFGRIPVMSVPANLVIVPMVSLAVVGILVMLVADLIWPMLGLFAGSFVNCWLDLILRVLNVFGADNVPVLQTGAMLQGSAGAVMAFAFYLMIGLAVWSLTSKRARRLFLACCLVFLNAGLVRAAVTVDRSDMLDIEVQSVPGGIATTVGNPGNQVCDLVITGLARKSYPIDERILAPDLRRRGYDRIGRLFILSAHYDAIDDVLRLARDFEADQVYFSANLRGSVEDVIIATDSIQVQGEIIYCHDRFDVEAPYGFFPSVSEFELRFGSTRLILTNQVHSGLFQRSSFDGQTMLLIGSNWQPAAADWIALHENGCGKIICSKIEQRSPSDYADPGLDPDMALPHYIYDLSHSGSCRFQINISTQDNSI
ncbi:MAG: hypothetical protein DRP45_05085 [Candidatus Zixiibacteriota bacterium]|nr:MAG: hypothetical protein DRP45_05085 [candidate division Zixibacteria bacterium]